MNRTEKQALIDDLHTEFGKSPHAILVDFRGLTVPAVTEFRRKVRQAGSRYRVVKNSLALRAVKDTPLEKLAHEVRADHRRRLHGGGPSGPGQGPRGLRQGPSGAASSRAASSRGARCSTPSGVKALSTMPSLPELRAKLLGLLQRPGVEARAARSNTPAEQLARVLKAHQEQGRGRKLITIFEATDSWT